MTAIFPVLNRYSPGKSGRLMPTDVSLASDEIGASPGEIALTPKSSRTVAGMFTGLHEVPSQCSTTGDCWTCNLPTAQASVAESALTANNCPEIAGAAPGPCGSGRAPAGRPDTATIVTVIPASMVRRARVRMPPPDVALKVKPRQSPACAPRHRAGNRAAPPGRTAPRHRARQCARRGPKAVGSNQRGAHAVACRPASAALARPGIGAPPRIRSSEAQWTQRAGWTCSSCSRPRSRCRTIS